MTDKKDQQPAEQLLPPTALQQAEQLAALQVKLDDMARGQRARALAAALRAHGQPK